VNRRLVSRGYNDPYLVYTPKKQHALPVDGEGFRTSDLRVPGLNMPPCVNSNERKFAIIVCQCVGTADIQCVTVTNSIESVRRLI
jgi:hypothetical protein